jgi:hypothetical protein
LVILFYFDIEFRNVYYFQRSIDQRYPRAVTLLYSRLFNNLALSVKIKNLNKNPGNFGAIFTLLLATFRGNFNQYLTLSNTLELSALRTLSHTTLWLPIPTASEAGPLESGPTCFPAIPIFCPPLQ